MKNSSNTIGKGTSYLLVCSAVPQPTEPARAAGRVLPIFLHKFI